MFSTVILLFSLHLTVYCWKELPSKAKWSSISSHSVTKSYFAKSPHGIRQEAETQLMTSEASYLQSGLHRGFLPSFPSAILLHLVQLIWTLEHSCNPLDCCCHSLSVCFLHDQWAGGICPCVIPQATCVHRRRNIRWALNLPFNSQMIIWNCLKCLIQWT